MKDSLSIFVTRDDLFSWGKYDEQIDLIGELTPDDERPRAKDSIKYLRAVLGEDFLAHAWRLGNPIYDWCFGNSAPHARRSLIRLGEQLRSFENVPGFKNLIAGLTNHTKAAEALTVLGAASSFSRVGFTVEFDPRIETTGKIPDLLLVDPDSGEEIYVEVSRLRAGGEQEVIRRNHEVVWHTVFNAIWSCPGAQDVTKPHVLPYVRVLRLISEKDIPDVLSKIQELIFDTARTGEHIEDRFKDYIEIAVSPAHDHTKAEAWAAERNMRDLVEVTPIRLYKELKKAIDKVNMEFDQIPPDKPGIIAIPTSENLLFLAFHPQQIIMEIADEVRRHPNLLCAVLFHGVMEGHQESTIATLDDHAFVTTMDDITTERTAFIMNDSFGLPLSPNTIERVRRAFVPL